VRCRARLRPASAPAWLWQLAASGVSQAAGHVEHEHRGMRQRVGRRKLLVCGVPLARLVELQAYLSRCTASSPVRGRFRRQQRTHTTRTPKTGRSTEAWSRRCDHPNGDSEQGIRSDGGRKTRGTRWRAGTGIAASAPIEPTGDRAVYGEAEAWQPIPGPAPPSGRRRSSDANTVPHWPRQGTLCRSRVAETVRRQTGRTPPTDPHQAEHGTSNPNLTPQKRGDRDCKTWSTTHERGGAARESIVVRRREGGRNPNS